MERTRSRCDSWQLITPACLALTLTLSACADPWVVAAKVHKSSDQHPPAAAGSLGGSAGTGTPAANSGEPKLPAAVGECPELETGTAQFLGVDVQLWVGDSQADEPGAVLIYWHGTGSFAGEVELFASGPIAEIVAGGGVVASVATSTGQGISTGDGTWTTGDYAVADQIVACALQQRDIDPHRIYTAGCSSGGLQAGSMVFTRSSYLAAAMTNSGGLVRPVELQDPGHVPALITAHGGDADVVVVNYGDASLAAAHAVAQLGGFAVDCNHGGGHCGVPAEFMQAQWQFLKDHPFGVSPEPYASGLPADFPDACMIVE